MRTLLFFDQIQAGKGGKEHTDVPLSVEKGGIGSYAMFEKYFKQEGLALVATMYAGADFFEDNKQECCEKVVNLIQKVKAEIVICGPTYDYDRYTQTACHLAEYINKNSECKAIVCCAPEKNHETIEEYKDKIVMVKMPKKGGVGLNESLHHMVQIAKYVGSNHSLEALSMYLY